MPDIGLCNPEGSRGCDYAVQIDYAGTSNPVYYGRADVGTQTYEPLWQIKQMVYDPNGNLLQVLWANGADTFLNVWDQRYQYKYS